MEKRRSQGDMSGQIGDHRVICQGGKRGSQGNMLEEIGDHKVICQAK